MAAEVQSEVSFSYKPFLNIYHHQTNVKTRFSSHIVTKEEIMKITSNFKPKKSAGPNSIPTKILRLLADDIFEHLSIICNHLPLAYFL